MAKGPSWFQRLANRAADGLVQAINPRKAALRQAWRENGAKLGAMQAASIHNSMRTWLPGAADANANTLDDLPLVRERSRDAALNNPLAATLIRFLADHVIGTGIRLQPSINAERLGVSEGMAEDWQGACQDLWLQQMDHADITGKRDQAGLQRLIWTSYATGGDVFPSFPIVRGNGAPVGVRINLIEAERVATPPGEIRNPLVNGGVRTDKWGRPLGFYVYRQHPGAVDSFSQKFEFWPAAKGRNRRRNIMQVYRQERVGQARGVPIISPALPLIDQAGQYVDTTLLAAEMQAKLSFWIKSSADLDLLAAGMVQPTSESSADYNQLTNFGAEDGSINVLQKGDEVQSLGSTQPGQYSSDFITRLLRLICSIVGAPYEVTFGDLSGANYSSLRGGFQNFKRVLRCEQGLIIPTLQAYYRHVCFEGWMDGKLPPVPFMQAPDEWTRAQFIPQAIGFVDPVKEIGAFRDAIDGNLMTHAEVIASTGGDWVETFEQRQRENNLIKELGLKKEPAVVMAPPQAEPDNGDDEEEEDEPFGAGVDVDEEEEVEA